MDPLLLEALRFGLAILAGGIVAVIAQRLAFHDARRLEGAQARLASRALAANVRAELVEDQRVAKESRTAQLHRTAWDAARGLPWPDDVLASLLNAYVAIVTPGGGGWREATRAALSASSGSQPPRPTTVNPLIAATEVAVHELERILAEGWPDRATSLRA